jgi:GLPGLI family protein
MHYYFQPGNERISFRGDMGIYTLDFISNHGTNNSSTLLKIINKKMYVPPSESDKLFIFQQLKEGKVFLDKDTVRTILGYEARKATIQLKNGQSEIVVWYTPEIAIPTTNKNTPFAGIPGVML